MAALAWTYALAVLVAGADNLLANGGFEQMEGAAPAQWSLFVAPMPGAEGRVDGEDPHDGAAGVMLHNPEAYGREPANNWSQNVIADLGGKRVRLTGAIRTRDATEAALWAQCCTRRPWRVLSFVTTSDTHPRYGSSDWEEVSVEFDVPDATDFIAVRCVIKGRGTAWFDSIALREVTQENASPARAASTDDPDAIPEDLDQLRGLMEELKTRLDGTAADVATLPGAVPPEEAGLHTLLLDTRDSMDTVTWDIMQSNLQMKDRLDSLMQQIDTLQRRLDETRDAAPALEPLPAPPPVGPDPPGGSKPPGGRDVPAHVPHVFPFEEKLR
jgi:hypothetical protein